MTSFRLPLNLSLGPNYGETLLYANMLSEQFESLRARHFGLELGTSGRRRFGIRQALISAPPPATPTHPPKKAATVA
jgi:hypothetical protein